MSRFKDVMEGWGYLGAFMGIVILIMSNSTKAEVYVGATAGPLPVGAGGMGITVELNRRSYYGAFDYMQIQTKHSENFGAQPFIRLGKNFFEDNPVYLKGGVCITNEANEIVGSQLMFNVGVGLNLPWNMRAEWSHCSTAEIKKPNYGYDAIILKWRLP